MISDLLSRNPTHTADTIHGSNELGKGLEIKLRKDAKL